MPGDWDHEESGQTVYSFFLKVCTSVGFLKQERRGFLSKRGFEEIIKVDIGENATISMLEYDLVAFKDDGTALPCEEICLIRGKLGPLVV